MRFVTLATWAAVLLGATPTSAALMSATISGDFNDNPYWSRWSATFIYNTDRGTLTTGLEGTKLVWDAADGTPSPLMSYSEALTAKPLPLGYPEDEPWPAGDYAETFTALTHFEVLYGPEAYKFTAIGPGVYSALGFFDASGFFDPPSLPQSYDLDAAYDRATTADLYSLGSYLGPDAFVALSPLNERLTVVRLLDPAPAPEPTAWALMILGFGAVGAALRRKAILA